MSGTWSALGAILLWSTTATAFELSLERVSTIELMAGATVASTAFFAVVWLCSGHRSMSQLVAPRLLARSAMAGLANPLLYYVLLFSAYDRLPGHRALILNYTWPIFLALLAIPILKRKPGPRVVIGLLLSFSGVVVSYVRTGGGAETDLLGTVVALGSAVVWATAWLVTMNDPRPAITKLLGAFLFGSLYALVAVIATGASFALRPASLPFVVYVALSEMGLSFLLWLGGLERSENPGAIANLAYVSPFLSLVILRLVLREDIAPFAVVGLAFIVGGILVGKSRAPAAS